ncbi:MAG: nucleotide exchange factor GrpE [Anaerolineae bacterium]|nr:nucleotide exchange factor GrpE [Anaerolineae bacterium]
MNQPHTQNHQRQVEPIATEPIKTSATNGRSQSETDWQQVATQLQADMDNFRKRQKRQAEEATGNERERLLRLFLPIVDNLARALNHNTAEDDSLRQGVELTYREFTRLMAAEGVSRVETIGQPFDPSYHEALATIVTHAESGTIVEEVEAGYTLDGKLLRPAKVLVAA